MEKEQSLLNENNAPLPPNYSQPAKDVLPVKRNWILLLVAFLLALGIDLLVYDQPFGKQFAIIVNAVMLGAVILSLAEKHRIPWQSIPLMLMVSVSSILTVFRTEPYTLAALILFVMLGLALLLASMLSGEWAGYRLREFFKRYFFLWLHTIIGLPRAVINGAGTREDAPKTKKVFSMIGAVLLGVLIAVPLLLLFGKLLSSADSQFASNLEVFLSFFKVANLNEFWPHFFIVLFFFWGLAGALFYMLSRSHRKETLQPDKALVQPFLAHIAATVALGLVCVIFLVFIVGQWGYFFGGLANIKPDGYTYSSYARSGFFELTVAAGIAALVHYLFSSITKRETRAQRIAYSVIATLLLVLVGLVLVSAFQRLLFYEAAYGFTRDRLVAHIFMIFLGILLVALAVMEISNKLKHLALVLLMSFFLFGITLSVINVDRTITRLNIQQATQLQRKDSSRIDGSYLAVSVSEEAVPELYANYLNPKHSEEMHENLGKILACRALRVEEMNPPGKWHTYTVPGKAEYDFFMEHGKSFLETYPPEQEECSLGYTIDGTFVSCIYTPCNQH